MPGHKAETSELDRLYCERLGSEMITKPPSYRKLESTIVRLLEFCGHYG